MTKSKPKKHKVVKIKAWAVVLMNGEHSQPTSTFAHQKVVGEYETAYHFELYWREEEAKKRRSWINKPDQRYYNVIPVEITYTLP